ncbi:hypothetical protein D3C71_1312660 [compost metagenome]
MPPEAPQIRLRPFFLGGRGNRHDAVLARIKRCRYPADRPALAGRVVAFEHRHQRVAAHAFVTHQPGKPRLLGDQLFFVIFFVQLQGQVQAVDQVHLIDTGEHWRGADLFRMDLRSLQCALQARQQNPPHGQAAIMGIRPGDHMPGCINAAGAAQRPFTILHEPVVGLRLLPVQRADAPAVQRVVGQCLEACLHLLL